MERQVYSYKNVQDPGRIGRIWDPAPSRRAGALEDGIDVGVPPIPQILYRQEARECTFNTSGRFQFPVGGRAGGS